MRRKNPSQRKPAAKPTANLDAMEAALLQPKPLSSFGEYNRMLYAVHVRRTYRGTWGAGAEHLYFALIRALNLEHKQELLLRLAKPRPGRKRNRELAERILRLYAEAKNTSQIRDILKAEGVELTTEAIREYRKTRRKELT